MDMKVKHRNLFASMTHFGNTVVSMHDRYVTLAEDAIRSLADAVVPGTFLVDFFPWCKVSVYDGISHLIIITTTVKYVPDWFPGAGFKTVAKRGRELSTALRFVPYRETKEKVVRTPLCCFGSWS